jgi:DNA-binding MarR family transcriptional regulator
MPVQSPLPTLLSQVLVAFTIEVDNEFERLMPHRTTGGGSPSGSRADPWLVSLVMWATCMRFVGEDGVTVGELEALARTPTNLNGMQRWGYVVVESGPNGSRAARPRPDSVIRATPGGLRAAELWRPLPAAIEERWRTRFGGEEVDRLRLALAALAAHLDAELPDCLPILGNGLFSRAPAGHRRETPRPQGNAASRLSLHALLSRVLLAFDIDFEREPEVSFATSACVLRVLGAEAARVRDLPRLTGVSKEAISMALGWLRKRSLALIEPDPAASRGKVVRLTREGLEAQEEYRRLLGLVEEGWRARFGEAQVRRLRESLQGLFEQREGHEPRLSEGLRPHPGGWRTRGPYLAQTQAVIADPGAALPHYPMVLHRGGWPDGS